jgi:hypothetical protein
MQPIMVNATTTLTVLISHKTNQMYLPSVVMEVSRRHNFAPKLTPETPFFNFPNQAY